jgi:hypothetical protein
MEIILSITHNCTGEGGNILVQRKNGEIMRDMGTVKFEDPPQLKWLLKVLMEYHPYVSLVDSAAACIPNEPKAPEPC